MSSDNSVVQPMSNPPKKSKTTKRSKVAELHFTQNQFSNNTNNQVEEEQQQPTAISNNNNNNANEDDDDNAIIANDSTYSNNTSINGNQNGYEAPEDGSDFGKKPEPSKNNNNDDFGNNTAGFGSNNNNNNNNNNNSDDAAGMKEPATPASPPSSPVPIIARSVGAPLMVTWVTAHSTKKGAAMITGAFTIRTGIKLGDFQASDTVFEVKRSLIDLLQFRLGYFQLKPYIFIGDLPAEDAMKHDADEVLAFVHIIVNNPALCDSVLTWHLLTTPQEELKSIGLPGTFSVFKNVVFGSSSFFGPTQIPTPEQLKVEVFSPQMVTNEDLRTELFRVLDLVANACELAQGFSYSRIKFNQRAVHWERLRVGCVQLVATHNELNEASSMFENSLREIACDGALFWPWTMQQTLADEKLRIDNNIKRVERERQANSQQAGSQRIFAAASSVDDHNTNNNSAATFNNNQSAPNDVYVTVAADPQKYTKTPHPSIRLGHGFLNAANLTENICKQTVALDLSNLITVVTLMTKVDFACAQSASQAEEYFRNTSDELKQLVALLKTIKELASSANFNERELRNQLNDIGKAAEVISKKVTEMQEDLRGQMQSVRLATHVHVTNEIERWATGQKFTWMGATMLASEIRRRIHSEIEGGEIGGGGVSSSSASAVAVAPYDENNSKKKTGPTANDLLFLTENLPMFEVLAGKEKKEITFGPPVLEDVSLAFNLGGVPNNNNQNSAANLQQQQQNNAAKEKSGWFSGLGGASSNNNSSSVPSSGISKKPARRHAVNNGNDDAGSQMSAMTVSRINPQPRRERMASTVQRTAVLDDPFARI